jgi:hypothetical protein
MTTPRQHDVSRDGLRRALRDAERAQREGLPHLRVVMRRLFHPESPDRDALTRQQKAALLGVPLPARRAFLRVGGIAVVGAAAVAACSDGGSSDAADTTASSLAPSTTVPTVPLEPTDDDLLLAVASAHIEHTAIAAYDAVLTARSEDLRALALTDLAVAFRDHHAAHAAAINAVLEDSGQLPVPSDRLFERAPLPAPAELATMPAAEVVGRLRALEDQVAQTYITAVPLLTLPELRRSLLSIGAIEAKHVTAIDLVIGRGLGGYAATDELIVGGNYPTNESFLNS